MEGHFAFTQHTCIYTHLDHTRTTSEVTGVYIHIEVDTIITMFQVMPELINAAHVNLNLLSVMEITLTHIYIYIHRHTPRLHLTGVVKDTFTCSLGTQVGLSYNMACANTYRSPIIYNVSIIS